ncbi:anthranilate phosphoribosyltransferase [Anaerobium acetethylicum]|uniref:Anthranilate phosphoribosyltransferase n=1 Tax=Anaerobium acetethylicum TaxID=1619234 RepID=A0A1D3TZ41_9FIRM|nr:anthranilate phosphoribosyltransferase [Anaerobium acetethylicum]SCP99781.1 anthranilate phosphoribosyltransferase [Anaerobium acetethylicum]
MIQEAIAKLINKEDLNYEMAAGVMNEIMGGEATQAQISAYLTALHMKGETVEEITASAGVMRNHSLKAEHDMDVMDIVGTGGDCAQSINISTLASIIASAAGAKVVKHGNRAASSKCGTADVLEALGLNLLVEPETSVEILKEIGICFLFAQKYHTAMRYVAPVRREIRIPTIFNILGPLANPANANMQLLGVYDESLVEPLAKVLSNLGVKRGMVVFGQDRLDEISMSAPTTVCEINNGEFSRYEITPEQFGFTRCRKEDLEGGNPEENAEMALAILKGEKGPKRDAVIINAGAALHIAKGISLEEGIRLAEETVDSGRALEQLEKFVALTNR